MQKSDIPVLFDIALRAFQPDFDKYGAYPPLINIKNKSFMPPRMFGKTIFYGEEIVAGAFVLAIGKSGEIGAIFIDPAHQGKGYGRQIMLTIEQMHPKVKTWKLETPADSFGLHKFYEEIGYLKTKEILEPKSGMRGFVYEKSI